MACSSNPRASSETPDASVPNTNLTCTKQVTADHQNFVVSTRGPDATVLSFDTSRKNGYNDLYQTVDEGGQRLLTIKGHAAPARSELAIEFASASQQTQRVEASSDGHVMQMSIDGRALSPFVIGGDPSSVRFADAAALAPAVRVDPEMLKTLAAIHTQAAGVIPTCGQAPADPPVVLHPGAERTQDVEADGCRFLCGIAGDSCSCCGTCCDTTFEICANSATLVYGACVAAAVAAAVATAGVGAAPSALAIAGCTAALGIAQLSCFSEDVNCTNGCAGSDKCVGPECSGGTPSPSAPGLHCSPGAVCCNGPILGSGNFGTCCDSQSDCCGGQCLEGTSAGGKCTDPAKGVNCSSSGDVCGPPDNGFCCPGQTPRCRIGTASQTLCCAANAGDICQGSTACCPAGSPKCLNDSNCCGANDISCGPNSGCCPPPGTCAGGQCCNAPSKVCGSNCCASTDTCMSDGTCCGPGTLSALCGSTCCSNLSQTCLGGTTCCANGNVCGSSCCGSDQVCTDASTSTCGTLGTSGQPTLELLNSANVILAFTNGPEGSVDTGVSVTVRGLNYDSGPVTISLDSVGGPVLATATATGGSGAATFNTPVFSFNTTGVHTVVGWEAVGGATIQASLLVNVIPLQ